MEIFDKLAAPFAPHKIHWRIGSTSGARGQILAYLDARDVMDRLDSVLGPDQWQDEYTETVSGRVICRLSVYLHNDWVTKSDGAGSTGFEGEKGGISDAFKRAAVKWGIGRYLYSIKSPWIECKVQERNGKTYHYLPDNFDGSKYLPTPELAEDRARSISTLMDAANLDTGDGVDAFGEAWMELEEFEQISFGKYVTKFYPGGVTAAKQRMRDVLAKYRERLNVEDAA